MQDLGACVCQILYPFGHSEVIRTKFLQPFIRGAKFIDRVAPRALKKMAAATGSFLIFNQNNKPITGAEQMPLNVSKKDTRLRAALRDGDGSGHVACKTGLLRLRPV
mgnify:CR=1 FL=1